MEAFKAEAGDIRTRGARIGHLLAKIAVRLYAQTGDQGIRSHCLDAIDTMEEVGFYGLSAELKQIER